MVQVTTRTSAPAAAYLAMVAPVVSVVGMRVDKEQPRCVHTSRFTGCAGPALHPDAMQRTVRVS